MSEIEMAPIEPQLADEALQGKVLEALQMVEDPELGMNIVDLGLIYGLEMDENDELTVTMTLTAMGCPLSGMITEMVEEALRDVPEVKAVHVNVVWNPPWSPDRMSKLARYALGFHQV